VLRFAARRAGARAYVALAGGVDVPVVLGARATCLVAGFGGHEGRALRAGDVLGAGPPPAPPPEAVARAGPPASEARVRVVLGPQHHHFDRTALERFLGEAWRVAPASDRVGLRLAGPPLAHRGPAEIVTDGMVPGCVQVPPDGQPILALADGPTTGGYPKIATVVADDLAALGQLVPGEGIVRFVVADVP
jgi:biotin-dependent carboxylase-like uncharacterized protein